MRRGNPSGADPGYRERIRTHVQIRIVGHASPQWRGAQGQRAKAALNKKLSEERAGRIRQIIERMFRQQLSDQNLTFGYDIDYASPRKAESDVTVGIESRGSTETLREAGGNLESNRPHMRRVEVSVRLTQMTDGAAPSSHPRKIRVPSATTRWAIAVGMGASVGDGPAAAFAIFKLKNRDTGEEAEGVLGGIGIGGGVKWKPIGTSVSWSGYTDFVTDERVNFGDFDGRGVRLTSLGAGGGVVGYERTYLTIHGMGSGAQKMHVGGLTSGALGWSGFVTSGNMVLLGTTPPPTHDEHTTVTKWDPYKSDKSLDFSHVIWFKTGSSELSSDEEAMLQEFVRQVSHRYVRTDKP